MKVDGVIHNVHVSRDNKILAAALIPKAVEHASSKYAYVANNESDTISVININSKRRKIGFCC